MSFSCIGPAYPRSLRKNQNNRTGSVVSTSPIDCRSTGKVDIRWDGEITTKKVSIKSLKFHIEASDDEDLLSSFPHTKSLTKRPRFNANITRDVRKQPKRKMVSDVPEIPSQSDVFDQNRFTSVSAPPVAASTTITTKPRPFRPPNATHSSKVIPASSSAQLQLSQRGSIFSTNTAVTASSSGSQNDALVSMSVSTSSHIDPPLRDSSVVTPSATPRSSPTSPSSNNVMTSPPRSLSPLYECYSEDNSDESSSARFDSLGEDTVFSDDDVILNPRNRYVRMCSSFCV